MKNYFYKYYTQTTSDYIKILVGVTFNDDLYLDVNGVELIESEKLAEFKSPIQIQPGAHIYMYISPAKWNDPICWAYALLIHNTQQASVST